MSENENPMESRTNLVSRLTSSTVEKSAGEVFFRRGVRFDPVQSLEREARVLSLLDGTISPRLFSFSQSTITMEYVGEPLTDKNLPKDYQAQAEHIAYVLAKAKVIHRDIKPANIMVHAGQLKLIDYGWALHPGEGFYLSPVELSLSRSPVNIYCNGIALRSALGRVQREV